MKEIKNILFDFDGVIMDSMPIRSKGFEILFSNHPSHLVEKLVTYHNINGGLSRYHKIRYFYEELLHKEISEQEVLDLANSFSAIMKKELLNPLLLISETVDFIRLTHKNYPMHVVSGSDGNELRWLCEKINLSQYFISIQGSPTPKNQLVKNLLMDYNYKIAETVLIGDSINDYQAAKENGISFLGFNYHGDIKETHCDIIDNYFNFFN